jgi:hypothetical protein
MLVVANTRGAALAADTRLPTEITDLGSLLEVGVEAVDSACLDLSLTVAGSRNSLSAVS